MDERCVDILENNKGVTVDVKTGLCSQELIEIINDYDAFLCFRR